MIGNQIKTTLLLGGLTAILLFIGSLLGGQNGLVLGLLFALAINFVSYWWSDKIVLKMYGAREADRKEYAELYALVDDIRQRAHLPMPKVYVINSPQANAFATGRNKDHAAVAVTTGILSILAKNELKGVLSHEIGHIKNKDILISTVAATIAGIISFAAMMARWAAIFGGFGGRDNGNNGGVVELLVLAIIAPIMAVVIQLAISRSREYLADETGARLIQDPFSLASALEKIERSVKHHPFQRMGKTEATAHLFIENPLKGSSLVELFSTHPTTKKRVEKLRAMTF